MLQNKKEQVYEIIKKKILSEEYKMGERINIGQLTTELGVSNSPVREALNLLEKEGLVINAANSGPRVVTLTENDLFELAQMVFFWMSGAYRYCCEMKLTAHMIPPMEKMLQLQKKYKKQKNLYEFTYYADYFDRCIIEATQNKLLLAQFDNIFPLFFLGSLYSQKQEKDWDVGIRQHETMLAAIQEERHTDVIKSLVEHYYKPAWDAKGARILD